MIVAIEQISFIGWNSAYLVHFLLNQAGKGRVFYPVDKCFETGADPRNISIDTFSNLDAMFVGILLRDSARDLAYSLKTPSRDFRNKLAGAQNSIGSHPKTN